MSIFSRLALVFTHGPELEWIVRTQRAEEKSREWEAQRHHLDLCFKHQQEQNHSHYSGKNCHYCQLLETIRHLDRNAGNPQTIVPEKGKEE